MKMIPRKGGFTIVEVTIAILVIGVLAVLAVPVFRTLQDQAVRKSEDNAVASVRSGISLYHAQSAMSGRVPPFPAKLDDAVDGAASQASQFFTRVLTPPVNADWQKTGLTYVGPTGNIYTYNPANGGFGSGGLVSAWGMGEQSGDSVGQGVYQAQITGNVVSTAGVVGSALNFDGQGSHLRVNDTPTLDLTTAGTLEAWVYVESVPPFAGIIHKGDKADFSDEAYSLQFWTGNKVALIVNRTGGNNYAIIESTVGLTFNAWNHIAATWDSSGMRLYLNGALNKSNTVAVVAQNSAGGLNIGAQTTQSYNSSWLNLPFDGSIDEVQVYNRALSTNEISAYYQATK